MSGSYTRTPNYNFYKPTPGADDDIWGDHWNWNADTLDAIIHGIDTRPAGGVSSWNGRTGAVTMTAADITALGFATTAANDTAYVNVAGDTMTGPLLLSGNATQNLGAVTLQQLTAAIGSVTGGATISDTAPALPNGGLWWDSVNGQLMVRFQDANSLQYVQANSGLGAGQYLPTTGGQLSGPLLLAGNATQALQAVPLQQVPVASSTVPLMDGTAAIGTGTTWARADHIHPTDTSRAAASALGNYVAKAGDTMSGGLHFGSAVASSAGDLSRHIDLYGGGYGFAITGNTLNYNSGSQHVFWGGASWAGTLTSGGFNHPGSVTCTYLTVNGSETVHITAPNGQIARAWYSVTGTRTWSLGCLNTGVFQLGDESVGQARMYVDTAGNMTVQQGVYAGYMQSYGDARVNGTLYVATGQVSDFQFMVGSPWRYMQFAGNWYWAWNGNNGTLLWNGGGNGNVFQIDGGGTTTQSGGNYNTYLHTNGAGWVNGELQMYRGYIWDMGISYPAWGNGNHVAWDWTGGTLRCIIDWALVGNIFSDARVKEVVGSYDRGLRELKQLKPIRYRLKGNDRGVVPASIENREAEQERVNAAPSINSTEKIRVGIIAQEVEGFLPEMFTRSSAMLDGERQDDVRLLDDGPWLLWTLVNAAKELDARLARLEKHA